MKKMNMANMQNKPREIGDDVDAIRSSSPVEMEQPKYPYGLSITLNQESLEKLGLAEGELPKVGSTLTLMAKVEVTSQSIYETMKDSEKCLCLQITEMALEGEKKPTSKVLYDKKVIKEA